MERLKTAVAETVMNAIEHGNKFQAEVPVQIEVRAKADRLAVLVTDQSGDQPIPEGLVPDLEAKLAGLQSPRGWGMFLIRSMVDEMHVQSDGSHHTVELIVKLQDGGVAS
jgi:anti-sigma regulatory factor (Ser/Thr protein kinase)